MICVIHGKRMKTKSYKKRIITIMWSNIYWYFNIQKDKLIYQSLAIEPVIEILLKTDCLEQISQQIFKNKSPFPWMELILANSNNGNFATSSEPISYINLISIVCSKENSIDVRKYKDLLLKIAYQLHWKLFLEGDDHGNEGLEVK
jgi:hypothetical protein